MSWINFHTHTCYCDGSDIPENYVITAINNNFSHIGFSAHAPLLFNTDWNISNEKMQPYCKEINFLKEKYKNHLKIFLGLEADYIPGVSKKFSELKQNFNLDFIIGSVHLVKTETSDKLWFIDGPEYNYLTGLEEIFGNDIKKAVSKYFEQTIKMIENEEFDIIGHFDKIKMNNKERFFSEEDKWYKDYIFNLLEIINKKNLIIEINTRGIYTKRYNDYYPSAKLLKKINEMKIPVTISSDAHKPEDLNKQFKEICSLLKEIGFKTLTILNNNKWEEYPFDENGIVL